MLFNNILANYYYIFSDISSSTSEIKSFLGPNDLPYNIYLQILEQDENFKRNYEPYLTEDKEKKDQVNSIDLLTFLSKLGHEMRIMSFSNHFS